MLDVSQRGKLGLGRRIAAPLVGHDLAPRYMAITRLKPLRCSRDAPLSHGVRGMLRIRVGPLRGCDNPTLERQFFGTARVELKPEISAQPATDDRHRKAVTVLKILHSSSRNVARRSRQRAAPATLRTEATCDTRYASLYRKQLGVQLVAWREFAELAQADERPQSHDL